MNDLKPSDPINRTQPPKGAKLARISRFLGWLGLVIGAGSIPVLITISPRTDSLRIFILAVLGLTLLMGVANIVCAWRTKVAFTRSEGTEGRKGRPVSGVLGWLCLLAVVLNIIAIHLVEARGTRGKGVCLNYLHQIDGAKEQWALETKKTQTDTPTWGDLVGTDKYLKWKLECPDKGTYTIGNMETKPSCSKAGVLPYHSISE
jgi:hypothetical protein